ncbi:unnamed protein product [Auanema sp. JU1783]|nr:unnamed protein product [Auanema sp. JU1783]
MFSLRPLLILMTRIQKDPIREVYLLFTSLQFLSMLILTAQQTGMPFLARSASKSSKFLSTTSVFMMEVIKSSACTVLILKNCNFNFKECFHKIYRYTWQNKMETLKVSIPAFVYAVQNNLFYIALANIDATTYSVTYQLRILTTAILSVCLLGKMLSRKQWFALTISLIGVVMVQMDKSPTNSSGSSGNKLVGIVSVVSMCWTSAFAGVYFEKILKDPTSDMWVQNLRLSLMTLAFSLATMIISDGEKIKQGGLFQGWTDLVWLITILNAFGGLTTSLVIKYADNVKKTYCQTIAIGITAVISIMIGERVPSAMLALGVSLVIISVYIYTFYPPIKVYTLLENKDKDIEHLMDYDSDHSSHE